MFGIDDSQQSAIVYVCVCVTMDRTVTFSFLIPHIPNTNEQFAYHKNLAISFIRPKLYMYYTQNIRNNASANGKCLA